MEGAIFDGEINMSKQPAETAKSKDPETTLSSQNTASSTEKSTPS
jgi:hypothetical protein